MGDGYRWVQVATGGCWWVQVGAGRDGRLHHRAHLSVHGWRVTGDTALFKDTGHGCSVTSPGSGREEAASPALRDVGAHNDQDTVRCECGEQDSMFPKCGH